MVFTTKKPADVIDGTLACVGNVTKGALIGVAAFGVITVMETKDRGCVGCFSGFGKGFFVMIGLTFVGVVTGISQAV